MKHVPTYLQRIVANHQNKRNATMSTEIERREKEEMQEQIQELTERNMRLNQKVQEYRTLLRKCFTEMDSEQVDRVMETDT